MNQNLGANENKADLFFRYTDQTVYTEPRWKTWKGDKVNAVAEWKSDDNLDGFTINLSFKNAISKLSRQYSENVIAYFPSKKPYMFI